MNFVRISPTKLDDLFNDEAFKKKIKRQEEVWNKIFDEFEEGKTGELTDDEKLWEKTVKKYQKFLSNIQKEYIQDKQGLIKQG